MTKLTYFFPDSQDFIDPTFCFQRETRNEHRIRQRDDKYPHEVFPRPYDGILVSKAVVDGLGGSGKYSQPQRNRFYRQGVKRFFRLDSTFQTMGDCGAFTYADLEEPPYSVDEVIEFYSRSRFDFGVSLDHIVFSYDKPKAPINGEELKECIRRQEMTLDLADQFLSRTKKEEFTPLGVAHGWNPKSYKESVQALIKMGYQRITLGGMVPLKTSQILEVLQEVSQVRKATTQFHLLGIARVDNVADYIRYGVTSIDNTTALQQAFKDQKKNYHTIDGNYYTAIRIPQLNANPKLSRLIKSGKVDQDQARKLEKQSLQAMQEFQAGTKNIEDTLAPILEYEKLYDGEKAGKLAGEYQRTLEARPWEQCQCEICRKLQHNVVIFRGSERNRSRGFHNIQVFYKRLQDEITKYAKANEERKCG